MDILTNSEVVEIMNRVCGLDDDAIISAPLAAIYLGVSEKTLARLRQQGDGPPYIQYPGDGSRARNQKINYRKGTLKSWRDAHEVGSTLQAATVRGIARMHAGLFAATESLGWSSEILDGFSLKNEVALSIEQPFFVGRGGLSDSPYILYHALACEPIDFELTVENMCDDAECECVLWLPWGVALLMPWDSQYESMRSYFLERYQQLAMRVLGERIGG